MSQTFMQAYYDYRPLFTFDHHVYIHYTCLLTQLSDVTFSITGDNTFTSPDDIEVMEETPLRLAEWTPDYVI